MRVYAATRTEWDRAAGPVLACPEHPVVNVSGNAVAVARTDAHPESFAAHCLRCTELYADPDEVAGPWSLFGSHREL